LTAAGAAVAVGFGARINSCPRLMPWRTATRFHTFPGRDNHWLDGIVGSAVTASISGAILLAIEAFQRPARTRMSLSELARKAMKR
jgi:hypothetical protein